MNGVDHYVTESSQESSQDPENQVGTDFLEIIKVQFGKIPFSKRGFHLFLVKMMAEMMGTSNQPPLFPTPGFQPTFHRQTNTCFVLNPFKRDITPDTPEGSMLLIKATEGPKEDKRIEVSQGNCKAVVAVINSLASQFGWGFLVNLVSTYS